jgi:hypothetical protein
VLRASDFRAGLPFGVKLRRNSDCCC